MSLKNTKKKRIDDYFVRATHEDEHSRVRENKAHIGVPDRSMETMNSKEHVTAFENEDFFVTLETPLHANYAVMTKESKEPTGVPDSPISTGISKEDVKTFENDDFFATLETPRHANHAVMAKESKEPTGVPGSPISAAVLKEDVKTDESNDFSINLETICMYANHLVKDLFGVASSTKMQMFDDSSVNPADEMIEENSKVSVPSTSAIIKEEEEWKTGSSSPAKQTSLLEANETIFLSSSCEYANFEIGTSGTYGWEVDSGVSRLYRTLQHDFELGELGEDAKAGAATMQENEMTLLSTSALEEEENTSSSLLFFNTHPVSSGNRVTEGHRNTFGMSSKDDIKPDSASDEDYEPSSEPNSSSDEDCDPSKEGRYGKLSVADEINRTGGTLTCLDCTDTFQTAKEFERHVASHEDNRQFKCDLCDKRFKKAQFLMTHRRIHTGERLHECSLCEKRYNYRSHLKRHQLSHAKDGESTKCSFCDKRFGSSWHRQRHEATHTGQKSYECPVCKKCFSRLDKCQLHQRTHTAPHDVPQYAAYDRWITSESNNRRSDGSLSS